MDKVLIEEGNALYAQKKYHKAVEVFSQAIALCPSTANHGHRAAAFMAMKNFEKALQDNKKSIEIDLSFIKGHLRVAQCHCAMGDFSAAISSYQRVLSIKPKNKVAKKAMENLKQLSQIMVNADRAIKYGNLQSAYQMLSDAIQIDPCNVFITPELYCKRAGVLLRQRRLTDAIEDCYMATDLDDRCIKALKMRAKLFLQLHLYDDAAEDLEKILSIDESSEISKMLSDVKNTLDNESFSFYKSLDIPITAPQEDISKAKRQMSKKYHPDKNFHSTDAENEEAERMIRMINIGPDVLADPGSHTDKLIDDKIFRPWEDNSPNEKTKTKQNSYGKLQNRIAIASAQLQYRGPRPTVTNCIFIRNLHLSFSDNDLKTLCEPYGNVTNACICRTPDGISKGSGFVTFETVESAQKATYGLIEGTKFKALEMHTQITPAGDNCVFIKNLQLSFSEYDLKTLCEPYGNVRNVCICRTPDGISKGSGFVTFETAASIQNAIFGLIEGTKLNGLEMHTQFAPIGENCVFIKNLQLSFSEYDLKSLCEPYGNVTNACICRTPDGMSKGSGFVTFETVESAQKAIYGLIEGKKLHALEMHTQITPVGENCVFIKNLQSSFSEYDLKTLCKPYGNVTNACICRTPDGISEGSGFVTFETVERVQNAIFGLIEGTKVNDLEMYTQNAPIGENCVFIKNLPLSFSDNDLNTLCEPYGNVTNACICRTPHGISKGSGFVTFETVRSAQKAINGLIEGKKLNGLEMHIQFAPVEATERLEKMNDDPNIQEIWGKRQPLSAFPIPSEQKQSIKTHNNKHGSNTNMYASDTQSSMPPIQTHNMIGQRVSGEAIRESSYPCLKNSPEEATETTSLQRCDNDTTVLAEITTLKHGSNIHMNADDTQFPMPCKAVASKDDTSDLKDKDVDGLKLKVGFAKSTKSTLTEKYEEKHPYQQESNRYSQPHLGQGPAHYSSQDDQPLQITNNGVVSPEQHSSCHILRRAQSFSSMNKICLNQHAGMDSNGSKANMNPLVVEDIDNTDKHEQSVKEAERILGKPFLRNNDNPIDLNMDTLHVQAALTHLTAVSPSRLLKEHEDEHKGKSSSEKRNCGQNLHHYENAPNDAEQALFIDSNSITEAYSLLKSNQHPGENLKDQDTTTRRNVLQFPGSGVHLDREESTLTAKAGGTDEQMSKYTNLAIQHGVMTQARNPTGQSVNENDGNIAGCSTTSHGKDPVQNVIESISQVNIDANATPTGMTPLLAEASVAAKIPNTAEPLIKLGNQFNWDGNELVSAINSSATDISDCLLSQCVSTDLESKVDRHNADNIHVMEAKPGHAVSILERDFALPDGDKESETKTHSYETQADDMDVDVDNANSDCKLISLTSFLQWLTSIGLLDRNITEVAETVRQYLKALNFNMSLQGVCNSTAGTAKLDNIHVDNVIKVEDDKLSHETGENCPSPRHRGMRGSIKEREFAFQKNGALIHDNQARSDKETVSQPIDILQHADRDPLQVLVDRNKCPGYEIGNHSFVDNPHYNSVQAPGCTNKKLMIPGGRRKLYMKPQKHDSQSHKAQSSSSSSLMTCQGTEQYFQQSCDATMDLRNYQDKSHMKPNNNPLYLHPPMTQTSFSHSSMTCQYVNKEDNIFQGEDVFAKLLTGQENLHKTARQPQSKPSPQSACRTNAETPDEPSDENKHGSTTKRCATDRARNPLKENTSPIVTTNKFQPIQVEEQVEEPMNEILESETNVSLMTCKDTEKYLAQSSSLSSSRSCKDTDTRIATVRENVMEKIFLQDHGKVRKFC